MNDYDMVRVLLTYLIPRVTFQSLLRISTIQLIYGRYIDDLIKNWHVARRGYFNNVLCFMKKNSKKDHPYSVIRCKYRQLKNIRDALNFVTQTWRSSAGVMIQMLFIHGTYSRAK